MSTQLTPAGPSLTEKGGRSFFEDRSNEIPYFIIESGNECMERARRTPDPHRLFGNLWFEGEICILFADTNVGKSILAVQIADRISRGAESGKLKVENESGSLLSAVHFPLSTECPAQKVVYFDFELSTLQFALRFCGTDESGNRTRYEFHPNLYRGVMNPDHSLSIIPGNFTEFILKELERAIERSGAKVIVVDNITYLSEETETAAFALPLMKMLKRLRSKLGLSILLLAHVPKRDQWMPITRNDLQGSKMLINFCDSSFAIGESNNVAGLRYIKQIKARQCEIEYGQDNVLLARIVKPGNRLHFEFLNTANELDHIKFQRDHQRQKYLPEVLQLHAIGLSTRKIGAKLGISAMSVSRYLKTVTAGPDG